MNDPFRKAYTNLNPEQQDAMNRIKLQAQELYDLMEEIVTKTEKSERARCMNTARTNLETAIMWAVKGITTDPGYDNQ
jgi:L-lactate utilization protein LutC